MRSDRAGTDRSAGRGAPHARPSDSRRRGRRLLRWAAGAAVAVAVATTVPTSAAPCPAPTGGKTALRAAADSLAAGQWCEITTSDVTLADTSCYAPAQYSILQWSMSMAWDSVNRELRHVGESEGRHCEGHFKYRELSNTWENGLAVPGPANRTGHSYDHNAARSGTATSYYRLYNGTDVYSYNPTSDSWSSTAIPSTYTNGRDICYGIEWNDARGKLQFFDANKAMLYEWDGGSSWGTVATGLTGSVYCPWMEYNPVDEVMCFGGPNNMYCSTASGATTAKASPPYGIDDQADDVVADPVSGDLIAFNRNGRWFRYRYSTNSWSDLTWSMPPVSGYWTVTAGLPDHGVIAIVDQTTSSQPAHLYVYRHATGGGSTPDTQPPTAPGSLAANVGADLEVVLTWSASTDDRGVTGYRVFRDRALLGTTAATTYTDRTAAPSTTYTYHVTALDAAGNESQGSNDAVVTLPALEIPPPPDGMSIR